MIGQHRTAIVTGASRGIGVYIAQALAGEGMDLVLAARNAEGLGEVATSVRALGVRALVVPTDLRSESDMVALVAATEEAFGGVDVLVNNAAIDHPVRFHQEEPARIAEICHINMISAMILTRLALPGMLQRKRGHIVSIASLVAKIPFPNDVVYAASKAGLAQFTESLRAELAGTGVSASVILAGQFSDAGMVEGALKSAGMAKPKSVPTSKPEEAGRAVVHAIAKDAATVAVPAPAMLFTSVPSLGKVFLNRTGVVSMVRSLAEANAPA